ncbi:BRD4-interacting chromatin-remodeling complex-associated protein-like [Gastrophryne carolinensis]
MESRMTAMRESCGKAWEHKVLSAITDIMHALKEGAFFYVADMDDDDVGLLDFIGDRQALNYYLHGSGDKDTDIELTHTDFSAPNSIFANASLADSKSSSKTSHSPEEEESKDGMELSTGIQYYEDELEASPMADLCEDILQKSLQEANITEQILAEEAYLDASIGSGQQFPYVPFQSHSSASFTQASSEPSYSGQTLHPIGLTHVPVVPQHLGASFPSNTLGVQHGFMQHVGIIPSQQMQNSSHGNAGQIHVIGSINNQSPVMTINNLDGSQIILKSGQQGPANAGGGLLVQRQTPNGSTVFGSPNTSPAGQPVAVPFNSGHFQAVHNIIIHRGPAPNSSKIPINIQPKPVQVGQQAPYNASHVGMHHHAHQALPFVTSPQSSPMSPPMPVNQQCSRKPTNQQQGGGIVIHSPVGQQHSHPNQFIIPAGLSLSANSVQQIQAINSQIVQAQASHMGPQQGSAEHVLMSRNSASMVRHSQQYPGQMLHSSGSAVQIVPGQTFTSPGGQVILNHGPSQMVGGQMAQLSPTLMHTPPGQSPPVHGRSSFSSTPSGCPNLPSGNRFTVVSSGVGHQRTGAVFSRGGDSYMNEQDQNRAMHECHLQSPSAKTNSSLSPKSNTQQAFSFNQAQKKLLGPLSPVSSLKNHERQSHMQNTSLTEFNSGSRHLQHHLLHNKVDGQFRGMKRLPNKQLTKESLICQQIHRDQEQALDPEKSPFQSLGDAVQRLLPYHVFQGSFPANAELQEVDDEFETVATHLLYKTQAMLNKYHLLLLEDAKRITPSAEMVMLDRMFNQEERASLTQDKRTALVDPDGYLTEFCCYDRFHEIPSDEMQLSIDDIKEEPPSPGLSPTECDRQDQTDSPSPETPDTLHSVPTDNFAAEKCVQFPGEKQGLKQDAMIMNAHFSPTKQLFVNICKLKGKYTSCPSDTYLSCKASKETGSISRAPKPIPVSVSRKDPSDARYPTEEPPEHSLKSAGKESSITLSSKSLVSSEAVKATVRNVLELKLSAKHLKRELSGGGSAEGEFVKFSEDNCTDKVVSRTRERVSETDSILEAAVNSILDC